MLRQTSEYLLFILFLFVLHAPRANPSACERLIRLVRNCGLAV
jgi:hypothetical protein